jgi:uncharacterized protein (DUF39 family)
MGFRRTYAEINDKIKKGQAVVVTAEEVIGLVEKKGVQQVAREVDVVTTGTFGAMCSSGVFLNFGHSKPRIRMNKVWLNGVLAYGGIAAVDAYLGATEIPDSDPENKRGPGRFLYGGGHVIEDLVARKPVRLEATAYPTDCYPRRRIETTITLDDINDATLFNPRNAYQNYNVAVNSSGKTIYTYMGMLKPNLGNASYSSAGQLSPLLNDPYYRTIGIGTRIFLGGGVGYVAWNGTQHSPCGSRSENGVPTGGSGTLAVIGDLKQMHPQWLRGTSLTGYGVSLTVGLGIPIPILDEEMLRFTAVRDEDILATVYDYSEGYPQGKPGDLGQFSYAELKSGKIIIEGKEVPTNPMSSYPAAGKIAHTLKEWITRGEFYLTEPVQLLPSADSGIKLNGLVEKNGGLNYKNGR